MCPQFEDLKWFQVFLYWKCNIVSGGWQNVFLKLGPLLVSKTTTPFGYWLQQFAIKYHASFEAKNWNRCHRACTIAQLCASCEGVKIGIARISTTAVVWFRCALNHMKDGRCNTVRLTALCTGAFYQESSVLASRAWVCRRRCIIFRPIFADRK